MVKDFKKGKNTWSKDRKLSKDHKQNISEGIKGNITSEETKLKMSLASKGKPKSLEHRKKLAANLGKKGLKYFVSIVKKNLLIICINYIMEIIVNIRKIYKIN